MSEAYLPYHRRFRPKTFVDYIGNERVKKSAMSALKSENRPQVLLFQGPAGCGKTTMARLMAKEYLCENRHPDSGACGECDYCRDLEEFIETGNSGILMNVREVDVTESNRRQDIDELLEDAATPSFDGKWKVYILDECHKMSNTAQNRLLKNLEEPPERVLMLLCTTDPQMLLETIISRCQYIFSVTKPTRDELAGLLARVCTQEQVKYDARALSLVCVKGDFVPRKSLVILEQIVREKGSVTYKEAVEVLNVVVDEYFFEFYSLLLAPTIDTSKYVTFIGNLKTKMDLKHFLDGLVSFTLRGIYISNGVSVEGLDRSEISQYKKVFKQFSPGDLAFLLDTLLSMKGSLDIETRLILLGYTGLKPKAMVGVQPDMLDPHENDVATERKASTENFIDSITMTEDEKKDFIEKNKQPITGSQLAEMFRGERIGKID